MTVLDLNFHGYRYFPYEHRLARLEVTQLLGVEPEQLDGFLRLRTPNDVTPHLLDRLTYFQDIVVADGERIIPQQALLEASVTKLDGQGRLRRQQTRYSAHGLHEYRGKFNPQMVRVIVNLLGLNADDKVWDPFCGSGTVLLEARHQGFNAVGVDLNPLAVAIANAKLDAIGASPDSLTRATEMLTERIRAQAEWLNGEAVGHVGIERTLGKDWLERFPCSEYLARWFPISVLAQFRMILDSIDEVTPVTIRDVFRIILSDIVRDVSWQDPGDLRVRRRKDPAPSYPAIKNFLAILPFRVDAVVAARRHVSPQRGQQHAFKGDSSDIRSLAGPARDYLSEGIDCVISSPPYATALPYLDTQRLSIALFGLATVQEIRQLDSALVGSREVTTQQRRTLEQSIEYNRANVAEEVWRLCKALKNAFVPDSDGFRRQNVPAVVYRYFAGMTRVMALSRQHLRQGGWLAFVVGPNRTSLGGHEFYIDTPALLAATGKHVGLELVEMYDLDAYHRYDMHSRNSIREERLLIMRRV